MAQIGFIGAGQMAQALAAGIARSNTTVKFLIADPSDAAQQTFQNRVGDGRVNVAETNVEVFHRCEAVFLAIKPQYLQAALDDVREATTTNSKLPLIISVMAGVRIERITKLTGNSRVVRVMPNTPCLIGQGASAMAVADQTDSQTAKQNLEAAKNYLEPVGLVVTVSENLLDSVTGLSGSGPAFVFSFIEAMIQGAVLTGLPLETAQQLAVQTVIGAAMMVQQTGEHTSVLRDRVTSPGGTTIAGLKSLEEKRFRDAVMSAVIAATERSRELGKLS